MTALQHIEQLLPRLTPEEKTYLANLVLPTSGINHTPGVNGGAACIGSTRIAVWMLEAARREGLSEGQILEMYPSLHAADIAEAWRYVEQNQQEIEREIQENEEA